MSRPWTWWLASAMGGIALALLLPIIVLMILNRNAPDIWAIAEPQALVGIVAASLVGLVLATRRPENPIGWLLLVTGLTGSLADLLELWGVYALVTSPGSGAGAAALWLGIWVGLAGAPAPVLLLLLFPSGHFASRRARVVAGLTVIGTVLLALGLLAMQTFPPDAGFPNLYETTRNPTAILGPVGPINDPSTGIIATGICGLLAVALLLGRFRAARGLERQQYKWVVLAMMLVVLFFVADFITRAFGTSAYVVTSPAMSISFALIPVAMGIAILRFHLFDIDRVISRALAYALLTAGLLSAYGVGIVLFQRLLDPLAGSSDLAVAATTLLVAALFRPLRARIQRAMDRRFNRAHYDAARIIEEFSSQLRGESDLATIGSELQAVISQTMQPTHVSLWLRSPGTG